MRASKRAFYPTLGQQQDRDRLVARRDSLNLPQLSLFEAKQVRQVTLIKLRRRSERKLFGYA